MSLEKEALEENILNPKFTKVRIIKNLGFISFSFLLIFMSYDGLSMLQASMNHKHGVGVISQAVAYLGSGIASLLLPKYVVKKFGSKTTILSGVAMYLPYEASNYYPEFFTMIPTAILLGIGASLLWGAQSTYFNECCFQYWRLCHDSTEKCSHSTEKGNFEKLTTSHIPNGIRREETTSQKNLQTFSDIYEKIEIEKDRYGAEIFYNETIMVKETSNCDGHNISVLFTKEPSNNLSSFEYQRNTVFAIDYKEDSKLPSKKNVYGTMNDSKTSECDHKNDNKKSPSLDSINALFFGFHGFVYQTSMCFSNLISYYVFNKGNEDLNYTVPVDCYCGADFCNDAVCFEGEILEKTPKHLRYMFTSISIIIGIIGVLVIVFFVDSLGDKESETKFNLEILSAAFRHAKKKEQIFLIPLSFYVGMEEAYFIGDYTRSYIACSLGIYSVGLITTIYGVTCAISSSLGGLMVTSTGRIPVFLTGLLFDMGTCVLLLLWKPNPDESYMFYLSSASFGIFSGIFWSQVVAFYGILFKDDEEAAFGFHYLCISLGATVTFVYNDYICSYVKLYIMFVVAIVGFIGYLVSERLYCLRKSETEEK